MGRLVVTVIALVAGALAFRAPAAPAAGPAAACTPAPAASEHITVVGGEVVCQQLYPTCWATTFRRRSSTTSRPSAIRSTRSSAPCCTCFTGAVPVDALPPQVSTFLVALDALGDPVADEAYFRANTPRDLALNALAFNDRHQQMFGIDGFWNNLAAEPQDAGGTPFEVLVTPMNVDMQAAFTDVGVENTSAIHPANHSDVYRNARYRGLLEFAYDRLQHRDGHGTPPAAPTTFNWNTVTVPIS